MNDIKYSPLARQDLQEIKEYIEKELQNPSAAVNVVSNITKRIRMLADHPQSGPSLSAIVDAYTDYRFLACGGYTAFYRYEDKTVYIDRVLYGRRDFMKVLFGDLPDENHDE